MLALQPRLQHRLRVDARAPGDGGVDDLDSGCGGSEGIEEGLQSLSFTGRRPPGEDFERVLFLRRHAAGAQRAETGRPDRAPPRL